MMATNVATGLEIEGEDQIRPVKWDEWIQLPVRPEDYFVRTVHGQIRVPRKRPRFSARGIRERDGNRCQYTGTVLKPEEGSIDHVVPRSRGGPNSWDNCVWASKRVNAHKGNRLPDEVGLRLLKLPRAPRELPVSAWIENYHEVRDRGLFLRR
jgi:5-methylcytosine-specific restriction endonuclease McrA